MVVYSFYETDNRVRRYAETLVKRGDEVDVLAIRRDNQPAFEIIRGVNVYRIQKRVRNERSPLSYLIKLTVFFLRSAWVLTLRHLRHRYDLIHVHSVPDTEVFAAIIPRLMGARVILDIHDIVPEFYASKFKVPQNSMVFRVLLLMEKVSAAFSNHVIIANHLWYTKLTQRSVPPEKCTAIINYPDPSIFSHWAGDPVAKDELVACYPGTLNWHQGVDLAVTAIALLRDKTPRVKLLIIGDGPDREKLKAMIKQEELDDRVTLLGLMSIEQVAKTMATIDLGVVPKRRDGFGDEAFSTKIMEFLSEGVPVVVSRTRIDQYYFNEKIVQFFESENCEDLAAKILELARDIAKRRAMREQGEIFIQENNWDRKKEVYLNLVDRLVGRRAACA